MSLLPAAVETLILAAMDRSWNLTATPLRPQTVAQPGGGWALEDVTGNPFPCRLVPLSTQTPEELIAAQPTSRMPYWLAYPVTTDPPLTAQDRVGIGSGVYEVQAAPEPAVGYAPIARALVWRDSE